MLAQLQKSERNMHVIDHSEKKKIENIPFLAILTPQPPHKHTPPPPPTHTYIDIVTINKTVKVSRNLEKEKKRLEESKFYISNKYK